MREVVIVLVVLMLWLVCVAGVSAAPLTIDWTNSLADVTTSITDGLDGVLPIAIPIFGALLVLALVPRLFKRFAR